MYDVQSIASRIKKEAKTQYKQEKKFEQEHGIVSNSQLARPSRATNTDRAKIKKGDL